MAEARLKIAIEALNKAKGELTALKKQLGDVDSSTKKASTGWEKLSATVGGAIKTFAKVGAGAVAVGTTIKKFFDFTREGAGLVQLRDSFGSLGMSLDEIRKKAGGTIDDMTLMAGALTTVAGTSGDLEAAMKKAYPQFIEIARAANKLNPSLGDTSYMLDSITLAAKRQSKLIADNLGIIVNQTSANEKYAASIGKSVTQLTDEEKQLAFVNGLLEAGGNLIEQVGGNLETASGSWDRLAVSVKNATDALKEQAANALMPSVDAWAFVNDKVQEGTKLFGDDYLAAVIGATLGIRKARQELTEMEKVILAHNKAMESQAETTVMTVEEWEAYQKTITHTVPTVEEAIRADERLAISAYTSADAMRDFGAGIAEAQQKSEDFVRQQAALEGVLEQYNELTVAMNSGIGPAIEEYKEEQADLNVTLADLQKELAKLEETQGKAVITQNSSNMTAAEAEVATLKLAAAQEKLASETDPLKAAQLTVQIEKLTGQLGGAASATTTYVDNSKKMEEVRAEIEKTEAALAQLEQEHTRQTGQILMNFSQQMAAADGVITQEELDWVAALGEKYGILDRAGAIALQSLKANFDNVTSGVTSARSAVDLLQAQIDALSGKDISINILYQMGDIPYPAGGAAPGGGHEEMRAAGGVSRGGRVLVGEQGPEMVNLPAGARVMSNPVTNNYYNLTMNTRANASTIRQDFMLMRAMG